MNWKIVVSEQASNELDTIYDYITLSLQNPNAAKNQISKS